MRRLLIAPLVVIVLADLTWMTWAQGTSGPGEQNRLSLVPPKGTPLPPVGMKALDVKPGPEPFTREDVSGYFRTHNLPRNRGSNADFQVEQLEFLSAGALHDRLQGVLSGLPDDARVGFVTLRGTIIFTGPPTMERNATTFERAYAVFSAATGNLLMVGSLDSAIAR
jgi:hypothetical protein